MFCPLCKAEYLEGFYQCTDCRVGLVASRDEAQQSAVLLWKGDSQKTLDTILAALDSAGIPSHYKETVSSTPRIRFVSPILLPVRPSFEFAVWVFSNDLSRAKGIVQEILEPTDDDD